MIDAFPGKESSADMTEEEVAVLVRGRVRCSGDDVAGQIANRLQRVTFKPDISDPEGAALQYARTLQKSSGETEWSMP